MNALIIFSNTILLALNVAFIERGAVFESNGTGVSWINVGASLLLAFSLGMSLHAEMTR